MTVSTDFRVPRGHLAEVISWAKLGILDNPQSDTFKRIIGYCECIEQAFSSIEVDYLSREYQHNTAPIYPKKWDVHVSSLDDVLVNSQQMVTNPNLYCKRLLDMRDYCKLYLRWLAVCGRVNTISLSLVVHEYLRMFHDKHILLCSEPPLSNGNLAFDGIYEHWCKCVTFAADDFFFTQMRGSSPSDVRNAMPGLLEFVGSVQITGSVRGFGIPAYVDSLAASTIASFLEIEGVPYWHEYETRSADDDLFVWEVGSSTTSSTRVPSVASFESTFGR